MNRLQINIALLASLALPSGVVFAQPSPATLPQSAARAISFQNDIRPILETSCLTCHGRSRDKGGFRMDTRDLALKGGDSGPAIIPGKSAESRLIHLVASLSPEDIMPQKGARLTPEQVGLLRAWIDQGLPWDRRTNFRRREPANLFPRKPIVPIVEGLEQPIDRLLAGYFARLSITPPELVSDRLFARRVWLDALGLLPPPDQLQEFLDDSSPDKRERLVDRLLHDNPAYAQHWLTFWNDLLRNDYEGTGFIDNGRRQITSWLYESLATNKPYNQFVSELVNPPRTRTKGDASGFLAGIVWRGVVNASQKPEMQAAQNIAQIFLGVNIKCASCHDSFINDYTLKDAYGLASAFSKSPLEIHECNQGTGQFSKPYFLYPQLGGIDADKSGHERREQLAKVLTSRANGRVPRAIVNRLWARLMGHGLVEPVDEMDLPAWSQNTLDWLATDLVANNWDLKKTLARIMTSRAYQLPAVDFREKPEGDYEFHGPHVRRLDAEQFRDALTSLTGVGFVAPVARVDFSLGADDAQRQKEKVFATPVRWIWNEPGADKGVPSGLIVFRRTFVLPEAPVFAAAVAAADNSYELFINNQRVKNGRDWERPDFINMRPHLRKGTNVIAVKAANAGTGRNAAGFIFYGRISTAEKRLDIASDSAWKTGQRGFNMTGVEFDDSAWKPAAVLGSANMKPWQLRARLEATVSGAFFSGHVRASLVSSDTLTRALGRPNREQVVSRRPSAATTLQAIELTNGDNLAAILAKGADRLVRARDETPGELIERLYTLALGRRPSPTERELTASLIGSPVEREGLEDFLWSLAMHPEFQLIY